MDYDFGDFLPKAKMTGDVDFGEFAPVEGQEPKAPKPFDILNVLKAVPAGAIAGIEQYVRSARVLERATNQDFGITKVVDFLSESAESLKA